MNKSMLFFVLLLGFASCKSSQDAVLLKNINKISCMPSQRGVYFDSIWYAKHQTDTVLSQKAKQVLSQRVQYLIKDIGIANRVNGFVETPKNNDQFIEIVQHIQYADAEVESALAVLNCEIDRSLGFQNFLNQNINRRNNRLTVSSIIVGSFAPIITGLVALDPDKASENNTSLQVLAISAGAVGGYLGFRSLFLNHNAVFEHPFNPLKEVIDAPKTSTYFPPIVWRFMSKDFEINGKKTSGVQILKEKWQFLGLIENPVLLENKGTYKPDLISLRIDLLRSLVEEVNLMRYDLKRLSQELSLIRQ